MTTIGSYRRSPKKSRRSPAEISEILTFRVNQFPENSRVPSSNVRDVHLVEPKRHRSFVKNVTGTLGDETKGVCPMLCNEHFWQGSRWYVRVQRNTLYKAGRGGTPGRAMRRRRREEGGELIESEQRISGMAYSSSGSLLLFFFLPACLFSSLYLSSSSSSTVSPLPCLAPSFVAPCTPFGRGTEVDR